MTENEMIERVARALCAAGAPRLSIMPTDRYVGREWRRYQNDARAAIEAMREPTRAMRHAAMNADSHEAEWEAMIDAALDDSR